MQTLIFFDLETTDKNPIGQILNFCFTATDGSLKIIDSLEGEIKISALQLPSAGAILTNRTNVLEHQKRAAYSEREAMLKIQAFISSFTAKAGTDKVALTGFNSGKFDIPYLRTSFYRNGLNPYFGGAIMYRDILIAARKLALSRKDFPRVVSEKKRREGDSTRASLSLETLCRAFGILEGAQSHHSRDDVLLSIELAKLFRSQYDLNLYEFQGYEATTYHKAKPGTVVTALAPDLGLESEDIQQRTPMTLLSATHRAALWINLTKFKKEPTREAIKYVNMTSDSLFVDDEPNQDPELIALAQDALQKFKGINLNNYFETSSCDIEQDIYRIDMSLLDDIAKKISGKEVELKTKDAKVLEIRYRLANANWQEPDAQALKTLHDYAMYRYSGKLKVYKGSKLEHQEGVWSSDFHPTFNELMNEIDESLKSGTDDDKALMQALKQFYLTSPIYKAAGKELEAVPVRVRPAKSAANC